MDFSPFLPSWSSITDLVFGELMGFHKSASLSSLRLGASLRLYCVPSSSRGADHVEKSIRTPPGSGSTPDAVFCVTAVCAY